MYTREACTMGKKVQKIFSDKNAKDRSWNEIGEIVFHNWLDLECTERNKKEKLRLYQFRYN